jgi:hypothetical protein
MKTLFRILPLALLLALATAGSARAATVTDAIRPSCAFSGNENAWTQKIQDFESGLASIVVTKSANVTATIPAFTVGTTSEVDIPVATISNSLPAQIFFDVADVAGNTTINCRRVVATPTQICNLLKQEARASASGVVGRVLAEVLSAAACRSMSTPGAFAGTLVPLKTFGLLSTAQTQELIQLLADS